MDAYRKDTATINIASIVYGADGVDADDPAELYHEASTLYPTQIARQLPGVGMLAMSTQLQHTVSRSVKRYPHVATIPLTEPLLPPLSLADALARRRSRVPAANDALTARDLSTLLYCAAGLTARVALESGGAQHFRTSPSAGALYPSEIYVFAFNVDGVAAGLYHVDPLARVLETVRIGDLRTSLCDALPMQELAATCAAAIIVTSMFWRARFKYGQRGYRFALLDAGHLAQNILLGATALGLAAVPVGGFYDRALAQLLGIDGVNEAPVYVVPVGTPDA